MKTVRIAALLALVPGVALAAITGSKHDLSATTGQATLRAAAPAGGGTNQICVFCHTPHNARSTNLLWNRATIATASFSNWGATNTTAGTLLPGTIGDVSRRCLSCHDGSTAVGAVVNLNGVTNPTPITMTGADQAAGRISNTFYIINPALMAGHHPVSIPYASAAAGSNIYNGITSLARQSATVGDYFPVQVGGGCQSPTNICTTSPTGADIQLYAGAGQTAPATNYGIECSSCHDTHNERNFPRMLRVDNESATNPSGLCMGCHNK